MIADAASVVRDLRAAGKTVLLHCVHAHTRTPVVAAAYGALITGDEPREVLLRVVAVLPAAHPRRSIARASTSSRPTSGALDDRTRHHGTLVLYEDSVDLVQKARGHWAELPVRTADLPALGSELAGEDG